MKKPVLESELKVGMLILNKNSRKQVIYTIIGEKQPPEGFRKSYVIHSSDGNVFGYDIPNGRVSNYPFLYDGEILG